MKKIKTFEDFIPTQDTFTPEEIIKLRRLGYKINNENTVAINKEGYLKLLMAKNFDKKYQFGIIAQINDMFLYFNSLDDFFNKEQRKAQKNIKQEETSPEEQEKLKRYLSMYNL